MPHDPQTPLTSPVPEEVFRLNLAYLLLAQRLVLQDEIRAEIVLGVREPLASWLRAASGGAIATLASAPVAIHALRLPEQTAANLLAACTASRWLGPAHVAAAAVERSCG
jgi:flagellar transcriptional activator FlhD